MRKFVANNFQKIVQSGNTGRETSNDFRRRLKTTKRQRRCFNDVATFGRWTGLALSAKNVLNQKRRVRNKIDIFSCVACFGGCPCGQYYCLGLKCVQGIEDGERNKEKKGKSHETTLHVDSVTRFGEISSLWQILTSL